jgi:uncharacterized protein YjbJ (UPF0337 family)
VSDNDSGPGSAMEGAVEGIKGKVKEVAGRVGGDEERELEGVEQQEKAKAEGDVAAKEAQAEKARAEAELHETAQRSHQR